MLAGVAGGLADYWDADPSLVRVIWALLIIFTGGLALVVYIVMAIVVPEERPYPLAGTAPAPSAAATDVPPMAAASAADNAPNAEQPTTTFVSDPREARRAERAARRAERRANRSNTAPVLIGAFLVILGAFFLAREWWPQIDFDWFWPAMLIVIGVVVLAGSVRREDREHQDEDRGSVR
jgi:phage shock protein C